jgi:hypothetical protein
MTNITDACWEASIHWIGQQNIYFDTKKFEEKKT